MRQPAELLIVFLDFSHFDAQSKRVEDAELADTIDAHYERVARTIEAAGGTTVKFIGDATLAVFPEYAVDAAVRSLLALKASEDRLMEERGWQCRLDVKAHFGRVIAGMFGADGNKRYDVIGRTVNDTARLKGSGVALSAEAFEKLSPESRELSGLSSAQRQ